MKKYEFTGKKLETTIEEALNALGKKQEDVDINIITEGGLFKKCKIEVIVQNDTTDETLTKEEQDLKQELLSAKTDEEAQAEVQEETKEEPIYSFQKVENNETSCVCKEEETQNTVDIKQEETETICEDCETLEIHEKVCENKEPATHALSFVEGYLNALDATNITLSQEEKETSSVIHIDCDKNACLIGYKGETLRNLQYLVNVIEQRNHHCAKRVILNVGDYNTRHEEKLKELARHKAEKVLKFRKRIKLDPMNAYDRRIVHEELAKMENIQTHSEGIEPNRRLVIEFIR